LNLSILTAGTVIQRDQERHYYYLKAIGNTKGVYQKKKCNVPRDSLAPTGNASYDVVF
jgi:hypothetical protein